MVSYQLGLRALQEILHRPDIQSFHQVRFWDDDDLEAKPILAYLCLGRSGFQLVQTSHIARQLEADMRPLGDDLFGGADVEDAGEGDKYGAAGSEDMMPDPFVYEDVEEVVVHAQMEDHFGIILTDDRPKLHLSSVYRKDVVSDLTIYFNTHMIHKMNTLLTLRVSFTGMSTSDPSKAYRHPAIRMFKDVPKHMLGRHVFYRRGYMFLGPSDAVDRYELMDNRPTSTYVYRTLDSTPSPGRDVSNSKHLLVRFLPPKAMGVYDNLSLKRFELWTQSIAHATALREYEVTQKRRSPTFVPQSADIASLRSAQLEASGVDPSEASLQETTGKGAAFVPQYVDSYMVVRQGTYRKKLNVVGDQSAWLCYRVHIYTATREIGVFGVRRMFLPPMLDTYQDMVFILFGRRFDGKLTPDPGFMPHLESVIDSISPVSAALQTRIKQRTGKSLSQGGLDPTYYDRVVLQARANALFYNKQMFGWLRNQPGLNVSPNTKFIDKGCDELARIFCNSIVRLMDEDLLRELADENRDMMNPVIVDELEQQRKQMESVTGRAELPEKQLPVYVDNPLSIIFRMQSGGAQSSSSDDGGVSEDSLGDWRRRIANYFAYCVDGGQLPSFLTINRLAESVKVEDHMMEASARDMISNPHTHTIDRVLEFLLYLVPADAAGLYEPADNIIKKVQLCQDPETSELVPGFICNEWVMVRLLQTQYIEQLVAREVAEGAKQSIMGAKKILTYLLKGLLQLTHNLELIEAVTVKVETATIDNASELIDPYMHMLATGNDMLKTLAIRGLTAINLRQSEERVVTHPAKPVELCMAIIRDSKSADLLLAAVHFIKTAYRIISMIQPNPLIADKRSGSSQADDKSMRFIDILLTMLDRAFNTQVRHHPRILGDIAMILLYISRAYPRERAYLIEHKVIERLMAIIEHYDTYSFILPEVTGALTLILTLNKNQDPRHRRRAAFDMAEKHAKTLVPCLRQVSTSTQMKVTNNILATLDIFLDPGDGSGADGMAILYSLTNDSPEFDFNRILAVVERKGAELERSGEDRVRKTAKITNRLVDKFRRMIHQGTMSGWEGRSAVRDAPGLDGDDDL